MEKKLKKKSSQNPKTLSKSSKTNFTTSDLQFNDDGASRLIGSIVEKGISDEPRANPVPPPKPTVLPFPVARHRSHGLHWAPSGSSDDTVDCGDNGLSGDDKGFAEYDSIAHLANPVERNNRKGMELSSWKELLSGNNNSVKAEKSERSRARPGIAKNQKNVGESTEKARKNEGNSVSVDVKELDYSKNIYTVNHVHELKKRETHFSSSGIISSGIDKNNEREDTSLESQIDAENRARLQGMSPEEIVEAQAEIMERLNPSLLKLLKKKGEERMKLKSSGMDISNDVKPIQKREDINEVPTLSASEISTADAETSKISNDTKSGLDNGEGRTPEPSGGSLWSTWSERVERARGLRFSLDGTIVEGFSDHIVDANCVAERDFLRTEGDPGAAGYTIKEAVALTRSVIPGQRALALHILCSALENAVQNIYRGQVGCTMRKEDNVSKFTDWQAIWAYALGPEPELVLSLRMCLDDNHNSVVLGCAKVIQCILTCDVNENFFNVSEKATLKDISTAPVFRSRPEVDVAFLCGGFWKYNAKSSNILNLDEDIDDETDDKNTIQDDIVVAGQDFAAGLVRMGIIPRLCYLLESDPSAALEECIVSILIAITRHSPTCANAVMNFRRLIETVVKRFTSKESTQISTSMIKAVSLVKVLAQSDRKNCLEFLKNGTFLIMTRNLFKHPLSLDHWVKSGKENCKLNSALTIEQLRLWKICILHGYCVSYFPGIFPSMCLWLNPPSLKKLNESSFLGEYSTISAESYRVLEALARTLPNFFSQMNPNNQIEDMEVWSWSQVSPMVDSAVKWIDLMSDLNARKFWRGGIRSGNAVQDQSRASLLWVYSSVMGMLVEVLRRVIPDDTITYTEGGSLVPWLPEFVPKIGLAIIKNRFLNFSDDVGSKFATDLIIDGSFVENLCFFRLQNECEASLASICCLRRLIQSVVSIDKLIQSAKKGIQRSHEYSLSHEEEILSKGILKGSLVELRNVQSTFMKLAASEWKLVQSIEVFGRGGPAPGVGIGWGASGGGFWSATVLLAEADARLTIDLFETFQVLSIHDVPNDEEIPSAAKIINASLAASLISGPREDRIVDKAFKFLASVSVLKYLDLSTRKFILLNKTVGHFEWEYKEKDLQLFSKILTSHFNGRWLSVKKRKVETADDTIKKDTGSLSTIYENSDTTSASQVTSSTVEWAHQRLPLPVTWFLSPISTLCHSKQAGLKKCSNLENLMQDPDDWLEIASAGLFFLFGIESISNFLPADIPSTVQSVPLVWKLHSLSVILLVGMNVIEENKNRDIYKALQNLYGECLDKARHKNAESSCEPGNKSDLELLRFQSNVHDSYSTFIETLVEQFSAISYGDLIYGRQVALYMHRCVEAPVRLAAWNALSNACVLELLPNLESCIGEAEGYLQPIEDKAEILEAYVKSWTSGALDRAANRRSIAYTLVLHHLSYFIFHSVDNDDEKLLLRNKLARLLLRDFSLKQHHGVMMLNLLRYNEQARSSSLLGSNVEKKLEVLIEASERNSSLLMEVNKLKSLVQSSL